MKKTILITLLVLLGILLIIPSVLPKTINTAVKKTINSPIDLVFEEFNNLKKYAEWNALAQIDSAVKEQFLPPFKGEEAAYRWQSENPDLGNGKLTIKKMIQNQEISYDLMTDEDQPPSNITVSFTSTQDQKTEIVHQFSSYPLSYLERFTALFAPQQIKEQINQKLNALAKKMNENTTSQPQNFIPNQVTKVDYVGQKMLVIRNQTQDNRQEIKTAIAESLATIKSFLFDNKKLNPEDVGYPTIYWRLKNQANNKMEFLCGYPINQSVDFPKEEFELFVLPNAQTLATLHFGSRDSLDLGYQKIKEYAQQNNLKIKPITWEVYVDDKSEGEQLQDQTKLFVELDQ